MKSKYMSEWSWVLKPSVSVRMKIKNSRVSLHLPFSGSVQSILDTIFSFYLILSYNYFCIYKHIYIRNKLSLEIKIKLVMYAWQSLHSQLWSIAQAQLHNFQLGSGAHLQLRHGYCLRPFFVVVINCDQAQNDWTSSWAGATPCLPIWWMSGLDSTLYKYCLLEYSQ
jgi:hypothetical protein